MLIFYQTATILHIIQSRLPCAPSALTGLKFEEVSIMGFYDELQEDYRKMLDVRESLGYSRATYSHYIPEFIHYCAQQYPDSSQISREMFEGWILHRIFPSNRTFDEALSKIRAFTKYLVSAGKQAFIPDERYHKPYQKYIPYILSDAELSDLFCSIDNAVPDKCAPKKEYILPVLFRMMYCCGMRPTEPIRLRCRDISLETGEIFLRQTKNCKDRRIVMSEDLLRLCRIYDFQMGQREYFFEHWKGGPLNPKWMLVQFHRCFESDRHPERKRARPYDLRHTFATHILMGWVDGKRDIMSLLPFLSAYMGHADIRDTLYYYGKQVLMESN